MSILARISNMDDSYLSRLSRGFTHLQSDVANSTGTYAISSKVAEFEGSLATGMDSLVDLMKSFSVSASQAHYDPRLITACDSPFSRPWSRSSQSQEQHVERPIKPWSCSVLLPGAYSGTHA